MGKLQNAFRATIEPEAFERTHGTVSFRFKSGEHRCTGIKVMDSRGNEAVRVMPLETIDRL